MSAEKKRARNFAKAENFFGCNSDGEGTGVKTSSHSTYAEKVRHDAPSSQEMTFVEAMQTR